MEELNWEKGAIILFIPATAGIRMQAHCASVVFVKLTYGKLVDGVWARSKRYFDQGQIVYPDTGQRLVPDHEELDDVLDACKTFLDTK